MIAERTVKNREFEGIGLYHDVPIVFIKGEIFRFHGLVERDLSQNPFPSVHVSFSQIGNSSNKFACTEYLEKGQSEFEFSCKMEKSGRFYFTMFAGTSGFFSRRLRLVNEPKEPVLLRETPTTPSMLQLSVVNNDLYVKWGSHSALTKLRFTQKEKVREFLLSNYHQKFRVPFYEFEGFAVGEVELELMHASSGRQGLADRSSNFSAPLSLSFQAVEHKFSKIRPEAANIDPIPWRV